MNWQIIIGGITLGLLSSLHCVGMCGPIAMALPVRHLSVINRSLSIVLYHLGRIMTYASLGTIMGLFGKGIFMAGLQQWFSIMAGVLIIISLFFYFVRRNPLQPVILQTFYLKVQQWMKTFLTAQKLPAFFLLGMANGLLPCGMVYVALAAALTMNSPLEGSLFMMMYGAGTLPAMIAFSVFGFYISISLRSFIKKAQPVFLLMIALVLILRGMNLGIPYISPLLNSLVKEPVSCH